MYLIVLYFYKYNVSVQQLMYNSSVQKIILLYYYKLPIHKNDKDDNILYTYNIITNLNNKNSIIIQVILNPVSPFFIYKTIRN